jgi:hypothetical protein
MAGVRDNEGAVAPSFHFISLFPTSKSVQMAAYRWSRRLQEKIVILLSKKHLHIIVQKRDIGEYICSSYSFDALTISLPVCSVPSHLDCFQETCFFTHIGCTASLM